jgi:hypothetical protein
MDTFRRAWENQTRILTEAVDDIVIIDDLLAVTGSWTAIQRKMHPWAS